jgi:hypothetical protein
MRRLLALAALAMCLALGTAGTASADPLNHFETFTVTCGDDVLVITEKPGASTVVTFNGEPSTSVSILMGLTVTDNGDVLIDFHKPFTEHQDVTICHEAGLPAGVEVTAEVLNTPPV